MSNNSNLLIDHFSKGQCQTIEFQHGITTVSELQALSDDEIMGRGIGKIFVHRLRMIKPEMKTAKKKQAQAPKARVILVTWHKGTGISPEVIDTFEAYTTITGFCNANPGHNISTVMYWIMRRKEKYATQDVTVERIPLHRNKH